MDENRDSQRAKRFQGWLAFLTSAILLGLLATGFVIALVRLIQWAWRAVL